MGAMSKKDIDANGTAVYPLSEEERADIDEALA